MLMEKNNAQLGASKGNSVPSDKIKQDGSSSSKNHQRSFAKRRESNNAHKQIERRTSSTFRTKNSNFYDKRPRQRNALTSATTSEIWTGDLTPSSTLAVGIDKPLGSKKHNLNHLLNFNYTPRESVGGDRNGSISSKGKTFRPPYNKEQFLQANCQFIVRLGQDYSKHTVDPDTLVNWEYVEEVRFMSVTTEAVCPICLYPPVAAKITRCGHIYCWSCILHYLALSDRKWRKCPICYDAIHETDLRSVSALSKCDYKLSDEIVFCLMRRKKGSVIATPANNSDTNNNFGNLNEDSVANLYQKILTATPKQVVDSIVSRELTQLERQLVEEKEAPEVCFIESALEELKVRQESLIKEEKGIQEIITDSECSNNKEPLKKEAIDEGDGSLNNKEESTNKSEILKNQKDDTYYYFYQAKDGQHIYLNPLNVKMLIKEYGSLDKCPQQIRGKVLEIEWASMSEQLRKKLRYMQHLPLSCEFKTMEIALESHVISSEVLEFFKEEVLRKQSLRDKRERDEKRRERHIQAKQEIRVHGVYPKPQYQLNNRKQFPEGFNLRSVSPSTRSDASSVISNTDAPELGDTFTPGTSPQNEPEFPSFATLLREGNVKFDSNNKSKVAIPTTVKKEDLDSNYEGQIPTYHYSLGDALQAAFDSKSDTKSKKSKKNRKGKKNRASE